VILAAVMVLRGVARLAIGAVTSTIRHGPHKSHDEHDQQHPSDRGNVLLHLHCVCSTL
jgi:hypothetical protein